MFMVMVFILTSLAACGGKSKENTAASTQPTATSTPKATEVVKKKEPVELTFATFNEWGTQGTGIAEAFKKYEAATGNKVKVEVYPNDQFANVIKTKLATGDVPDFFAINAGENYIPFTNLETLEGPWVAKLVPPVKKQVSSIKDGAVKMAYFSPLGYLGMVYNKKVLEKAGVKLPLMNYTQLVDAMKAIQKTGVTPIMLMGKEVWTASQIMHYGGVYAAFEDPKTIENIRSNKAKPSDIAAIMQASERFYSLKPYLNKDFMSVPLSAGIDDVVNGKAGMIALGDWYYGEIAKKYPDKVHDVSIMPFTLGDKYISGISNYEQRAFAVPTKAKNKEEAKALINFLMQPENFKTLIEPFEGVSPYVGYDITKNQWQKEMETMMKDNNIPLTAPFYSEAFGSVDFGPVGVAYQDIFADRPIKQALDDWYKEYVKLNKAKKTPGFE